MMRSGKDLSLRVDFYVPKEGGNDLIGQDSITFERQDLISIIEILSMWPQLKASAERLKKSPV